MVCQWLLSIRSSTHMCREGVVAIAGDTFEREEDISDPSLWRDVAGSEDPAKQEESRKRLLDMADYIVPGHGPMFKVRQAYKEEKTETLKFNDDSRLI
jgi:glyoxylase-like metal-dependent hydrolase (beta-lactamase superfamily II)